jgi:hypothetical protein
MNNLPSYVRLAPESTPGDISRFRPFRAVVIVERPVSSHWQSLVSDWLVRSGCLYMLAWGHDCSSWDDAVDIANLEQFDYEEIPEGEDVMTTWHANQSLSEVFFFAKYSAFHPTADIQHTVLIHISDISKELEFLRAYHET